MAKFQYHTFTAVSTAFIFNLYAVNLKHFSYTPRVSVTRWKCYNLT